LGQQDKHDKGSGIPKEDELGLKTASEKDVPSEDTVVNSTSEEEKQSDAETDPKEDQPIEKDQEKIVNVDDIDSDDIPLGQRYGESVSKRLRSNKEKIDSSVTKTPKKVVQGGSEAKSPVVTVTPKTKTKTTTVRPKKGWSKVQVKSTTSRSRKRKIVSSSESDYDVEEDVQDIIPSVSKKSVGKKVVQAIANVPIDKVYFNLLENAQRWKFIYHRRLTLERELGKEALEMQTVTDLINEAGLLKTVSNLGNCYENGLKNSW